MVYLYAVLKSYNDAVIEKENLWHARAAAIYPVSLEFLGNAEKAVGLGLDVTWTPGIAAAIG